MRLKVLKYVLLYMYMIERLKLFVAIFHSLNFRDSPRTSVKESYPLSK